MLERVKKGSARGSSENPSRMAKSAKWLIYFYILIIFYIKKLHN